MIQKAQAYSKRFAESVINFANNIRQDLFTRTEFIIIGVLFFICFLNLAIIAASTHYLHLEIAGVVIDTVTGLIASGNLTPSTTNKLMLEELTSVRNSHMLIVGSVSITVTLLFGYVVARIALAPTRGALTAQKQFIGNVAHELRTPLSIVKANNEIILFEAKKNPQILPLAEGNIEEINRIAGIINNLLTLNTFQHTEQLEFTFVNVSEILHEAINTFARLTKNKHIILSSTIDDDLHAWGNKSAIAQIVMNLIKNAIVYTPDEGSVFISAYATSDYFVQFEIIDTGIGIEREKLRRIFEPFYQIDPSRSKRSSSSSGLGLAIVSELIKLHHGRITVRSTLGVGTTVEVGLPVHAQDGTLSKKNLHRKPLDEISMDFSENKTTS